MFCAKFGSAKNFSSSCRNFSWKIKFNKYGSKKKVGGFERINLSANSGDPSLMNEIQSIKTANILGLKSFPRIVMVDLYVDGVNYGPMDLV